LPSNGSKSPGSAFFQESGQVRAESTAHREPDSQIYLSLQAKALMIKNLSDKDMGAGLPINI
jgi:hypothetical protein